MTSIEVTPLSFYEIKGSHNERVENKLKAGEILIVLRPYPMCTFDVWLPYQDEHECFFFSWSAVGIEVGLKSPSFGLNCQEKLLILAHEAQEVLPRHRFKPSIRAAEAKRLHELLLNWS